MDKKDIELKYAQALARIGDCSIIKDDMEKAIQSLLIETHNLKVDYEKAKKAEKLIVPEGGISENKDSKILQ